MLREKLEDPNGNAAVVTPTPASRAVSKPN